MLFGMLSALFGCTTDRVPVGAAPPPALRDPAFVRMLALGDVGKGTEAQRRVAAGAKRLCESAGCDLVLLLGDNLYPRGMESRDDPRMEDWVGAVYEKIGAPVYLVHGNHDYGVGRDSERAQWQVDWASEREGFVFPANAWSTDAGPARIIGIDTNAVLQFGGAFQQRWLHERISSSDRVWNVVLGHHPYRSNGKHGNAGAYEGTIGVPFVSGNPLRTLFDEELCGNVDLYLSGHEHLRQLLTWCGTSLVVSGAGASTTQIIDRGNDPLFASASLGTVWIELGPTNGTIRFVNADGEWDSEPFSLSPR